MIDMPAQPDGPWDLIDEPSPRGSIARRNARQAAREGRVTVEVPPYVVSAPEWAARWGESAPPVGTILRWTPLDSTATYIAVCTGDDEWETTNPSNQGRGANSFAVVARTIANSPCSVAVDWREIPVVEARPAGDDAVKSWASQFLAEREVAKVNSDAGTPVDEGH